MSKKGKEVRSRGMNWGLVSQNVAIGVAIVILHDLAFRMGLSTLPLVGLLFAYFTPLAFIGIMTYFRSEQRTRGQAIAEGVFAACIFLLALLAVLALYGFLNPPAA
jgi:hypothetical protein